MIHKYDVVTIIYNPNSTGDAPTKAKRLLREIRKKDIADKVVKTPTAYAGHAIELAKIAATTAKRPLIIAVSGDGGYNEVINGVLASGNNNAVCTVEGAGNANDHWRVVHQAGTVLDRINKRPRKIAVLKLRMTGAKQGTIYAHSYIGLGLSAKVANALNKTDLNRLNEKKILLDTIMDNPSFRIRIAGRNRTLESIVAGNINEMAKQLKLDSDLRLTNKTFSLIIHGHTSAWKIVAHMIGLALRPTDRTQRVTRFRGELLTSALLQSDGETTTLPKGTKLTITRVIDALRTL